MFVVAHHQELLGTLALWHCLEVGYGKVPCDGLGGPAKRIAAEAVRPGKCVIQDASDFYDWAKNSSSVHSLTPVMKLRKQQMSFHRCPYKNQ